jgi:hypothetical protein
MALKSAQDDQLGLLVKQVDAVAVDSQLGDMRPWCQTVGSTRAIMLVTPATETYR